MENYKLRNSSIIDQWSNTLLAMVVLKAMEVHVVQEYLMIEKPTYAVLSSGGEKIAKHCII